MNAKSQRIPISECRAGRLYRLTSRNLKIGVCNVTEENGHVVCAFTGIREKFGDRYLDTEYHRDMGPPHGTALCLADIGAMPAGLTPALREKLPWNFITQIPYR